MSLTARQRWQQRQLELERRPKNIRWNDLPPCITEEQRQTDLVRSTEIREALHRYLDE
jgi:hypothetical protein